MLLCFHSFSVFIRNRDKIPAIIYFTKHCSTFKVFITQKYLNTCLWTFLRGSDSSKAQCTYIWVVMPLMSSRLEQVANQTSLWMPNKIIWNSHVACSTGNCDQKTNRAQILLFRCQIFSSAISIGNDHWYYKFWCWWWFWY